MIFLVFLFIHHGPSIVIMIMATFLATFEQECTMKFWLGSGGGGIQMFIKTNLHKIFFNIDVFSFG